MFEDRVSVNPIIGGPFSANACGDSKLTVTATINKAEGIKGHTVTQEVYATGEPF